MVEREAKLAIIGERPGAVADEIAALSTLAAHPLASAGTVALRDVYLDTPAGALRARGESLRVRIADGQAFVTLKGGGREVEPGVVEREELEAPWSDAAYTELLDRLADRGIRLRRVAVTGADPEGTLLASGLARIQARDTRRRLRDVEGPGPRIAELAIDEVTFHLDAGPIRHHEVEIEAKAPAGEAYLSRAMAELRAAFGAALLPWAHGKLATGRAIERLLASRDAGALVATGQLTSEGYSRLDAMLSAEPAPPGD